MINIKCIFRGGIALTSYQIQWTDIKVGVSPKSQSCQFLYDLIGHCCQPNWNSMAHWSNWQLFIYLFVITDNMLSAVQIREVMEGHGEVSYLWQKECETEHGYEKEVLEHYA